jgi:hypothetical protein
MKHFNIMEFIEETSFSADALNVHIAFIEASIAGV